MVNVRLSVYTLYTRCAQTFSISIQSLYMYCGLIIQQFELFDTKHKLHKTLYIFMKCPRPDLDTSFDCKLGMPLLHINF